MSAPENMIRKAINRSMMATGAEFSHDEYDAAHEALEAMIEAGAALYALVEGDDSLAIEARRTWLAVLSKARAIEGSTPGAAAGADTP